MTTFWLVLESGGGDFGLIPTMQGYLLGRPSIMFYHQWVAWSELIKRVFLLKFGILQSVYNWP